MNAARVVAGAPFQSDPSSSPGLGSFCIDIRGVELGHGRGAFH